MNNFKISRATAVRNAMNSMITEGFVFTEEEKKLYKDFADEKIETKDLDDYINNLILKWRKETPEIFTDET